jgi:hypothetical protein
MTYGVDGMAHISATARTGFAYTRSATGASYRDVIDIFRVPGHFLVSTTLNASLYAEDPTMVEDQRLQILNLPWEQQGLLKKRDSALSTDQTLSLDGLRKEEATVAEIRRGGGIVIAGTDSPLDNVGTALHLNLRAQVKFGLAPWQALQSATLLPARAYHKDQDLGSIEAGKLADLVFVTGNPLVNISDAANVVQVMKNGRLYSISDLEAPIKGAEPEPAVTTALISSRALASPTLCRFIPAHSVTPVFGKRPVCPPAPQWLKPRPFWRRLPPSWWACHLEGARACRRNWG